jgi:hypothetical protein
MDNDLQYVTDGKGNQYVISQEIKEGDRTYFLTRGGVFEKDSAGKCKLASKKINEKYMPLLAPPKIGEYKIEIKDNDIEK